MYPSKGALGPALKTAFETDLVASIPRLRRFAYALTGSVQEGDELVQAACERALRNVDRFQQGTRMDSWLFRIVQNLWLDSKRREGTRGKEVDPDMVALSDEGLSARRAEDRMMLERVRQAVAELPRDQRLVLALVAIDGMTYRDAAETLGLPIGTVMSRLSRARTHLSGMLEKPSLR